MIQANHIRLSFGERRLFNDISFDLKEDQRIGLVGANGSGKSTLLEAMVGLQALDGGTIAISKRKRVAYLAQDVVLSSSLSILDETLSAFSGLVDLQEPLAMCDYALFVLHRNYSYHGKMRPSPFPVLKYHRTKHPKNNVHDKPT